MNRVKKEVAACAVKRNQRSATAKPFCFAALSKFGAGKEADLEYLQAGLQKMQVGVSQRQQVANVLYGEQTHGAGDDLIVLVVVNGLLQGIDALRYHRGMSMKVALKEISALDLAEYYALHPTATPEEIERDLGLSLARQRTLRASPILREVFQDLLTLTKMQLVGQLATEVGPVITETVRIAKEGKSEKDRVSASNVLKGWMEVLTETEGGVSAGAPATSLQVNGVQSLTIYIGPAPDDGQELRSPGQELSFLREELDGGGQEIEGSASLV